MAKTVTTTTWSGVTDAEDLALVQDQIQVQGLRGRLTWAARPLPEQPTPLDWTLPLLDLAVQVQVASIGLVAVPVSGQVVLNVVRVAGDRTPA